MKLYHRENYLRKIRSFYHETDLIKVITGIRRCGKSCLMQTIAEELRSSGVKEENIVYLNLDKRGFKSIKTADKLESVIDSLCTAKGVKYLFIDEIQNVDGFEEVINAFREEEEYSIFITGSNSYLLSGELVTKLTGRYLEFEIFPLTFDEYIGMKQFLKLPVDISTEAEFDKYIIEGGFPKALSYDDPEDKRTYINGIIAEIFEKDIRKRVKIRKKETFELVRQYIINNFGATTSINNICEELKKGGNSISKATISRYIKALVDAKILYVCDRFDMKSKKMLSGEKKYYLSDLGFYYADNTNNEINYGPVLENIVFTYAKSKDCSVSVGRIGKLECDFITRNREQNYAYIQVAYTILASKETEDREYRPLETITDNYPRYVITTDLLFQRRSGISHVNLMDFMKEGNEF